MAGNFCDVVGSECTRLKETREELQMECDRLRLERDAHRAAISEAAMEINCAGPVSHRIRVLRDELDGEIEKLTNEIARLNGELAVPKEKAVADLMELICGLSRFARLFVALHSIEPGTVGNAAREAMEFLEKNATILKSTSSERTL